MSDYDCTQDVMAHKRLVSNMLGSQILDLARRSKVHDDSKLQPPEKEGFDQWTPELKARTFGTEYYKQALDAMGEFLQHHYQVNSHHPEHYPNGVDGMTLADILEMVCDWRAAALAKGLNVDLEHAAQRFNLSPQLVNIIRNTLGG